MTLRRRNLLSARRGFIKTASLKKQKISFGDRLADKVARVGSSWLFLICFGSFIFFWMILNTVLLPIDPCPWILLNLLLSLLASVQAPIIMMSQRRLEERDREIAEQDLEIDETILEKLYKIEKKNR